MNLTASFPFTSPAVPARATSQPTPLLLSAPESAAMLGMSVRRFHQLRHSLPQPVVLGARHVRWRLADLVTWVESLSANTTARAEPPQLQAGRAARKRRAASASVDRPVDIQSPHGETQHARGMKQSAVPSNPARDRGNSGFDHVAA